MSSCLYSIVTMALSCIVSEIKRDISRESRFFRTRPLFDAPVKVGRQTMVIIFGVNSPDSCATEWCKNIDEKFNSVSRVHQSHRWRTKLRSPNNVWTTLGLHCLPDRNGFASVVPSKLVPSKLPILPPIRLITSKIFWTLSPHCLCMCAECGQDWFLVCQSYWGNIDFSCA